MRIEPEDESGKWRVVEDDGTLLAGGLTNAQAWRWFDRHETQAVSDENRRRRISSAVAER